eukprot:491977-Prymnesium_polylepis.1
MQKRMLRAGSRATPRPAVPLANKLSPHFAKRAETIELLAAEGLRTDDDWAVLDDRLVDVVLGELRGRLGLTLAELGQ